MASLYELRPLTAHGIFAVPYRRGQARRAVRLPDGAIVEAPRSDGVGPAPGPVADCLQVAHGGDAATFRHASLGLVVAHLSFSGLYTLSDGSTAAVYGAEATPLGTEAFSGG